MMQQMGGMGAMGGAGGAPPDLGVSNFVLIAFLDNFFHVCVVKCLGRIAGA